MQRIGRSNVSYQLRSVLKVPDHSVGQVDITLSCALLSMTQNLGGRFDSQHAADVCPFMVLRAVQDDVSG